MTFRDELVSIGACHDAVRWVNGRDLRAALTECERADWILWLLVKLGHRQLVVRLTALCARQALQFWQDDPAPLVEAIEAAEAWAADPSEQNRERAVKAAAAAATATAYAAAAAAAAAYAATAAYAYAAAARTAEMRRLCDLIRDDPEVKALAKRLARRKHLVIAKESRP